MIKWILSLFTLAAGVSFAALNYNYVSINLYGWHIDTPIAVAIVIAFILGMLIAYIYDFVKLIKLKIEIKQLRKKLLYHND